ncbi:MAG: ATP-binding protein [Acidobacteria bacterium]|nr:ATP-binding protein [Acidobacteriota bacterium]
MKRSAHKQVILAVGLPGSGKSTYFAQRGIQPLCSDTLRLWLLDDETDQSAQDKVFSTLRFLLRLRLEVGRPRNYVDATNLTPKERRPYLRLAARYGYQVQAIYFDIPIEVCQRRNRQRHRKVPEEAMEKMARKLKPPTRKEGFSKITVIRLKRRGEKLEAVIRMPIH